MANQVVKVGLVQMSTVADKQANLNKALETTPDLAGKSLEVLLATGVKAVPESIRTAVRNNGGGHWNHTMFWEIMAPHAGGTPGGELASKIDQAFGNFEEFKKQFAQAGATRFGSGWAWPGSYTHPTPPTSGPVEISGVAVSLKKKQKRHTELPPSVSTRKPKQDTSGRN